MIGLVPVVAALLGGATTYVYRSGVDATRLERVEDAQREMMKNVEAHNAEHVLFHSRLAELQATVREINSSAAKMEKQVDRLVDRLWR